MNSCHHVLKLFCCLVLHLKAKRTINYWLRKMIYILFISHTKKKGDWNFVNGSWSRIMTKIREHANSNCTIVICFWKLIEEYSVYRLRPLWLFWGGYYGFLMTSHYIVTRVPESWGWHCFERKRVPVRAMFSLPNIAFFFSFFSAWNLYHLLPCDLTFVSLRDSLGRNAR